MNKFCFLFALLCSYLLIPLPVQSQEIIATVDIVTENLSFEHQMHVDAFKSAIEDYINSNRFSDVDWEGPKISVSLSIQMTPVGTRNYSANLFIASKRTIDTREGTEATNFWIEDRGKWYFEYQNGTALSYDFRRYDPISSLIDFYMLILIGLDLDTYGELDGDQCYQRARNVFDVAANYNSEGWSSYSNEYGRQSLIAELSSPRFDGFRKLFFEYYVDGIEILEINPEEAKANIASTIEAMADFYERYMTPSHLIDSWFYTKCTELCNIFKGYDNPKLFRNLIFLNSSNTTRYEAARDGK